MATPRGTSVSQDRRRTFLAGRLFADNVATSAPVLLVTSVAGAAAGVSMLLAFLPPARYVRAVEERARRRVPAEPAPPPPASSAAAG